jgi:hypothetical protein
MTQSTSLQSRFEQLQQRALVVGVGSLLLGGLGWWLNPAQFFYSYLVAYLFWLGIALGCLAVVMLRHLVRGVWGIVIQRLLESATRTLPLMALLFVPLLFGLGDLYTWAQPATVASDELLQHKMPYLNVPFFLLRLIGYFVVWITVAYFLNRWSLQHDRIPDRVTGRPLRRRLQLLSGPGLVLYAITITFAAVDWVMSLEPYWFSTIYGMIFIVGQGLMALAFATVAVAFLAAFEPFREVLTPAHWHDLGNLLLAFVMLWAYMAFSQFLIIWSGNLTEEIPWYLHRIQGGWEWVGLLLLVFHFALPFLLLLSRDAKRQARILATVAGSLLLMQWVELLWLVMPALHPSALTFHWLDVTIPIGIGGVWLAVFVWHLQRRPLLPLHEPRLQEVSDHG